MPRPPIDPEHIRKYTKEEIIAIGEQWVKDHPNEPRPSYLDQFPEIQKP